MHPLMHLCKIAANRRNKIIKYIISLILLFNASEYLLSASINFIMESSVSDTIDKIKLQENDKEKKLREKRAYEASLSSMTRSMQDSISHAAKQKQQYLEAKSRFDLMNSQLSLEKIKNQAYSSQLEASRKELELLKQKTEQGITAVWSLRQSLSKAVHHVSDQCDVWALLMRPQNLQISSKTKANKTKRAFDKDSNVNVVDDRKLRIARERLERLRGERDRLINLPDTCEEFKRIKNALQYSAEKIANTKL